MKQDFLNTYIGLNETGTVVTSQQGILSFPNGTYHIIYSDCSWRCAYVSEPCLTMLYCTRDSFLTALMSLTVHREDETQEEVGNLLSELVRAPGEKVFSTVSGREDGLGHRIENTLTSVFSADGSVSVYGQMTDITPVRNIIKQQEITIREYQDGLNQSGRDIYTYTLADRSVTLSPKIAEAYGVPPKVVDFPDWMVASGRIAPESVHDWLSLFDDIDRGEKSGSRDISVFLGNGIPPRRSLVQFIGFSDLTGKPVSALISYMDISKVYDYSRTQALEHAGLLQAIQMTYPEIISINLTKGLYRIIQYYAPGSVDTPPTGELSDMLALRAPNVAAEDRDAFCSVFSPDRAARGMNEDMFPVRLEYRRIGKDGIWHWLETTVIRQENPFDDDIILMAFSRVVDDEKIQEVKLRETVRVQDEELQLTMSQLGNYISYYDVATSTMTTQPFFARLFGIPVVLENYPESFIANAPPDFPPETAKMLRSLIAAIHRGNPTGSCIYPFVTADGETLYLRSSFVTIFNDKGEPARAVISSEDITQQRNLFNAQEMDISGLLKVTQLIFPEILSCNLTKDTFKILHGAPDPRQDFPLHELIDMRLEEIAPEDRDAFILQFSRENQLKAIENGCEHFQLTYRHRRPEDGAWHWMETTAFLNKDAHSSDIQTFSVSRNVDHQKMQEDLLQQALADSTDKLEDWLYYTSLCNQNFPGLIYINYENNLPSTYTVGTLAKRLGCSPRELALSTSSRIPQEDQGNLQLARDDARLYSNSSFRAEYRVEDDQGQFSWISNHAIHFTDKNGTSGYLHFLTDVTHEHQLLEHLRQSMAKELKRGQEVFRIVAQHSSRTLYAYDPITRTVRPWDARDAENDIFANLLPYVTKIDVLKKKLGLTSDGAQELKQFFAGIHRGDASGSLKLSTQKPGERECWYELLYTNLFDNENPTVLVSVKEITERHAQELAYQRHIQSIAERQLDSLIYAEVCLATDKVEKIFGQFIPEEKQNGEATPYLQFTSMYTAPWFQFEDPLEADRYFSPESLLAAYNHGEQTLQRTWQTVFNDGLPHWISSEVTLLADPYNNHIKAIICLRDVTESHLAQQDIIDQANHDAMTGLLRRDAGEVRIREQLEARMSPGGILLILDLDDLKDLNDTFGHASGDKAITGISVTLKEHFRSDDILVRAGGDEFLVFLPGAGKSLHSIELSLASLLHKLSAVSIGANGERTIHCSIGCAVEQVDDTFESLYNRADLALYHVKRNCKNNFAFFESGMVEEDYLFRVSHTLSVLEDTADEECLRNLLSAVSASYPAIIHFNLSRNVFRILSTAAYAEPKTRSGSVDDFWINCRHAIHPDDWEDLFSTLSRSALTSLYARGTQDLSYSYRSLEPSDDTTIEIAIRLFSGFNGNLCALLFFRRISPSEE